MELLEVEPGAVDLDAAAGIVVHLDGVAVIDDLAAPLLVVELHRRQLRLDQPADIDRRLVLSGTGGELRLQLYPAVRPDVSGVTPVGAMSRLLARAMDGAGKHDEAQTKY